MQELHGHSNKCKTCHDVVVQPTCAEVRDGTASVSRACNDVVVQELHGHLNKVYCIGVENDTVVSGSEDMTVKVRHLHGGNREMTT